MCDFEQREAEWNQTQILETQHRHFVKWLRETWKTKQMTN